MRFWLPAFFAAFLAACSPSGPRPEAGSNPIAPIAADGAMVKAEDPPAPEGWSAQPGVTATSYVDNAEPVNVFRLYQPAVTDGRIEDWFNGRRKTAPDTVKALRTVDDILVESGFYTGYSTGSQDGAPIALISYACKAGGGIRYGELVTSIDESIAAPAARTTIALMVDVCRQAIEDTMAATPAAGESETKTDAAPPAPVLAKNALKEKDIALVLYSWEQVYRVTGLAMDEYAYLLMKDGSARLKLPVEAPSNFDVAADRKQNPDLWGKWKKRGKTYELTRANGEKFTPPGQLVRFPAKKGERLNLYYEDSWSVSYGQTGGAAFWGIQLNKDGTFRRNSHSSYGGVMGYGDTATGAIVTSDDKGSASSVSTENFGGGASSSTGVTDADLTGTYLIDGYSLTLKYNSGKVQRNFFYVDDDRTSIWFEGDELSYINLDD